MATIGLNASRIEGRAVSRHTQGRYRTPGCSKQSQQPAPIGIESRFHVRPFMRMFARSIESD
jgi:hypothetical protein